MICHGRTTGELHTPLWEHDEKRIIEECTDIIKKHIGGAADRVDGSGGTWSGDAGSCRRSAVTRTCSTGHSNDQRIWMRTRSGPILSVPYPSEMNDFGTLLNRDHTGTQFADMIVNQFEEMLKQSEKTPLVCSISLHGFVVGRHSVSGRCRRQSNILPITSTDRVWYTTARDIANYCFSLPDGVIPGE